MPTFRSEMVITSLTLVVRVFVYGPENGYNFPYPCLLRVKSQLKTSSGQRSISYSPPPTNSLRDGIKKLQTWLFLAQNSEFQP